MPVFPPAWMCTSTSVVASHFKVPSDSGDLVGTVKAETWTFSILSGLAYGARLQGRHSVSPGVRR